jgi:YbbR domain-containing protein
VNAGRATRRLVGVVVHNWPLKLAAGVVATLLYAGLVASQGTNTYPGPIKVDVVNQPDNTVLKDQPRDVEQVTYIAPADLGRLRAGDFHATVDLANVKPDGNPVNLRVEVTPSDPRVAILDVRPRTISVTLDELVSKEVPVTVETGTLPDGLQVGDTVVDPPQVTVSGPSAAVKRVSVARVSAQIDASALNFDRNVQPDPVDSSGQIVTGVDLVPAVVHVTIPVYKDLTNRTIPVNPVVTGTPGAGFRIASIDVAPLVVTVEGDLSALKELATADTAPVAVSGATRDVTAEVAYALPTGVTPVGAQTAKVTVHIEAVTETRTFTAGIRLDGRRPELQYEASERQVLLTVFGSTADLDRLGASGIVISLNVADLEPGTHAVAVVPTVPSAVTVAAISPDAITVTVTERPTPTPAPTPTPTPAAEPSAPLEPTPAP